MAASQNEIPRLAQLLDQNAVLELGFAQYISTAGVKLDGTASPSRDSRLGAHQVAELISIEAEPGTKEEIFLFKIRLLVNTLANSLSRRLRTYLADNEMAETYRATELEQIDDSRAQTFWTNMIWRSLVTGGIGFALIATIIPYVNLHTDGKTGNEFAMSVLGSLVFAGLSKVFMSKIEDFKQRRVFNHYEWLRTESEKIYKRGQMEDYDIAIENYERIYKEFTGQMPPKSISILTTIAGDIRVMDKLEAERKRQTASIFVVTFHGIAKVWREHRAKKEREKRERERQNQPEPHHRPAHQHRRHLKMENS